MPGLLFFDPSARSATGCHATWASRRRGTGACSKPEDLHPVKALLARQGKDQQAGDARQRFFGGRFNPLRSWHLPEILLQPPQGLIAARKRLEAARQRMLAAHAGYETAYSQYDAADTTILQSRQIGALLVAKVRIQREHFQRSYASEADCRRAASAARDEQSQLAAQLEPFETAAGERLRLALELLDESNADVDLVEIGQ